MTHRSSKAIARLTAFFSLFAFISPSFSASPAPLKSAIVSEISGDVLLKKEGAEEQKASLNSSISGRDIIRTGKKSRAELEFADKSISRLGSNTIFSFDPQTRDMALSRGLAVVHVPPGKGGAKIATPAATAAIQGDTIVAEALRMPDGTTACKFTALSPPGGPTDGKIIITLDQNPNASFQMRGGEVAIVPQGATSISQCPRVEIDVSAFINTSPILKDAPPTARQEMNLISADQARAFSSGTIQRTDVAIDGMRVVKVDSNGNVITPTEPKPTEPGTTDPNARTTDSFSNLGDTAMPGGPEAGLEPFAGGPTPFEGSGFNQFNQFLVDATFHPPSGEFTPPQYTRYTGLATPSMTSAFSINTDTGSFGALAASSYAFSILDGIGHFSFNTLDLNNPGTITVTGGNNLSLHTENNSGAGNSLTLAGTVNFDFQGNGRFLDLVAENGNLAAPGGGATLSVNGSAHLAAFSGNVTMAATSNIDTSGAALGVARDVGVLARGNITVYGVNTTGASSVSGGSGGNIDLVSFGGSGTVTLNGALTATGGAATSGTGGRGGNISVDGSALGMSATGDLTSIGGAATTGTGGKGGNITILSSGSIAPVSGQIFQALGGDSSSGVGGDGGRIVLSGSSVAVPNGATSSVVGGTGSSLGGDGGAITITSTSGAVSLVTGANTTILNAAGGTASTGGDGGTISLNVPSGQSIIVNDTGAVGAPHTLSAAGGAGTTNGSNGTISSSGASVTLQNNASTVP